MIIQYRYRLTDDREEVFDVHLDPEKLTAKKPQHLVEWPAWTELDFNQCPNCPLTLEDTSHCPLAINLIELVERGNALYSDDTMHVEVIAAKRVVSKDTSAQAGLSSLLGLLTATSGCPHTQFLRPMAFFHLPLADADETVYRAASMYLLAQYFLAKDGKKADLELKGLDEYYKNLHMINMYLARRLKKVNDKDSVINAVTRLDIFSLMIPNRIHKSLEGVRNYFKSYFTNPPSSPVDK